MDMSTLTTYEKEEVLPTWEAVHRMADTISSGLTPVVSNFTVGQHALCYTKRFRIGALNNGKS